MRVIAFSLLSIGCTGGVGDTGSKTESYPGPFGAVLAEAADGRIEVVAGPAGEDVVTVEFLPNGSDGWEADAGDDLVLTATCLGEDVAGCGGGFILTVPPDIAVDAHVGVGGIAFGAGLSGDLAAQTTSGAIDADDLGAASVTALTGTGALSVSFAEGPRAVDLDSGSSAIVVALPAGGYALDLDTSGTLDVDPGVTDEPTGPQLRVHSGTGSITVVAQ